MVNSRTLGIFLDTLQRGDPLTLATPPAAPVHRAAPVAGVARDISELALHLAPTAVAAGARDIGQVSRADVAQPPSASLELSATAQWLQRALRPGLTGEAVASIVSSAPLLEAAPDNVPALAHALRDSIVHSGLFYEAHLAEWTMQRYPESDLRREPQAGWNSTGDATTLAAEPVASDERAQPGLQTSAQVNGHVNVDLLRAQLQALESRQFLWQGDVWPGQAASMTIAEDGVADERDLPSAWRTHLTLTLPELGKVDIDLRLDGPAVHLALAAAAPHSVELLGEARSDLVAALEAHAHAVASLGVRQS
jgi:hypothetical protein